MEYGLIGAKLGHSFPRRIHESMWCDDYALLELDEAQAQAFFRRRAFRGVNVTIPYKRLAASTVRTGSTPSPRASAASTPSSASGTAA